MQVLVIGQKPRALGNQRGRDRGVICHPGLIRFLALLRTDYTPISTTSSYRRKTPSSRGINLITQDEKLLWGGENGQVYS